MGQQRLHRDGRDTTETVGGHRGLPVVHQLQRSAGNKAVVGLVQRLAATAPGATFSAGAVVDPTTTLVVRGGNRIMTPSNKDLEGYNAATQKGTGNTWKAGTSTGQSVMSEAAALPAGKLPTYVVSVPAGLAVVQCNALNHAEFRTTTPDLTAKQIGDLLKTVALKDAHHPIVVQLSATER